MQANAFFSDAAITIGGRVCALRASIGALCAIERRTGMFLPELIALLSTSRLPTPTLRIILHEGAKAAGEQADDIADDMLNAVAPQLAAFLREGIGCCGTSDIAPDWREMFLAYVGVMQRPADEFRRITVAEYALALEGYCLANRIDTASAAPPATSRDLAEMIQRFPDEGTLTEWSTA